MHATKITAPNDVNGNPQRGWIIVSDLGTPFAFVDEGYEGRAALVKEYPQLPRYEVTVQVSQAEYRRWRRGVNLVRA